METEIADDGRQLNLGRVDLDQRSELAIFARLDRDPTQMASVLSAFSWRRRDLHHETRVDVVCDKRECSGSMSGGQLSWNWVSSAYIWDCTACRSSRSTRPTSSVYETSSVGPGPSLGERCSLLKSWISLRHMWMFESGRWYDWNHVKAMESMENRLANTGATYDRWCWNPPWSRAALSSRRMRKEKRYFTILNGAAKVVVDGQESCFRWVKTSIGWLLHR